MKSTKTVNEERKLPLCPHCMKPMQPFYTPGDKGLPTEMGLVCKSGVCKEDDGSAYRFSFKMGK